MGPIVEIAALVTIVRSGPSSATNLDSHLGQFSLACEQAVYTSTTEQRSVADCWLGIAVRVSVATAQGRIWRLPLRPSNDDAECAEPIGLEPAPQGQLFA